MTTDITGADSEHLLDEGWSTPLEAGVRGTIRGFIEALLEEELEAALGRGRYAHAPKRLAEEIAADYSDMIYADRPQAIEKRRKAFVRKWRERCEAVATSLEEAGDQLFTFTRLPVEQWKSARTTNAIERLHLEFKRRIKTQTVLPSAETAAMLFWALLASGQIVLRKVDGWTTIARPLAEPIDLAA